MINYPKISIVTPSFNQGLFLEACIKSIIGQGYPNLEYIVLDGGSSDLSSYILKKYSHYFSYWRCSPDKGQYHAIQEGFEKSTGDIFAWLNSDDMLHPGSLWMIANAYRDNPDALWFTGIPVVWNSSGEITYINPEPPDWSHEYFMRILDGDSPLFLQQESTFFTKKLWQLAGSKIDTEYKLAADFELWLRFSRYSRVQKLDALIGGFRQHGQQKTAKQYELYLTEVKDILSRERDISSAQIPTLLNGVSNGRKSKYYIATSLAPKDLLNQDVAINSWLSNDFQVLSFNSDFEIEKLKPLYPDVQFHLVHDTALTEIGKPLVYLKDIFEYFYLNKLPFTLINSDVHLSVQRGFAARLAFELRSDLPTICAASRVEIENEFIQLAPFDSFNAITRLKYGRHYFMGFDLFSFNVAALDVIYSELQSKSNCKYGLGIPWWDYFVPMLALSKGINVNYLYPSPIYHLYHEAQYSKDIWRKYGERFCLSFELIGEDQSDNGSKSDSYLDDYLNSICSQVIRFVSNNMSEIDLGAPVRRPSESIMSGIANEFLAYNKFHYKNQNEILSINESLIEKDCQLSNFAKFLPATRGLS